MDKTRKRGKRTIETGGSIIPNDTTNHHNSRTNMQLQQQLMASVSVPARVQYYCSARRVIYSAIFFVICIYIDIVASNVATNRWASELREEQKAMPLPDILHNSFELPDAKNISHKLLKELPLYVGFILVVFGFMLPYDVMGWHNVNLTEYRRYEACIRFMETRCVLELMRALSVWVTTQSDAHGLHCKDIEAHTIDNIFTTFTFGRCGDNMFSGHASSLLSFATAIQTYNINLMLGGRKNGSGRYLYLLATVILWTIVSVVGFYVVISRMHYTVDVLMSFFLAPTVWLAWSNVSWPTVTVSSSTSLAVSRHEHEKTPFLVSNV